MKKKYDVIFKKKRRKVVELRKVDIVIFRYIERIYLRVDVFICNWLFFLLEKYVLFCF